MNSRLLCRAIACVCIVLPAPQARLVSCQEFTSPAHDISAAFLADAEEEAGHGTYIFYTQEYRDQRKEHVSIHGSVYAVLRDVKLTGCDVEGTVQVFDLFSGSVKHRPTGETQDKTEYSIRFRISAETASGLSVFAARPSQLAHNMHTQCDADAACTFEWLRIRSARAEMRERIVLNNSITFDGPVNQLVVPVSSSDAGNRLIRDLQALAESRCR